MLAQDETNFPNILMDPSNSLVAASNENELDTQNNNILLPTNIENIAKSSTLNDATTTTEAVSNMIISSENSDVSMNELETKLTPREMDLIKIIQTKDLQIKELEGQLSRKEEEMTLLRTNLDKFQSVFTFNRNTGGIANTRKMGRSIQRQRAQGISAEPSQNSMHELLNVSFPKYEKQDR